MKLKLLLLISIVTGSAIKIPVTAQTWPGTFFKGYEKSIKGGKFQYHSPQPDVNSSLLLRSIDSASFICWETEMIPSDFNEPFANFVWMFGIDANPESHAYRVYLNDKYCLTFRNPEFSTLKPWSVQGQKVEELFFRTTILDKYDDPMGYAVFTVPGKLLEKGKRQVIRIVGESAASNVWYMTFESSVQEKLDIVEEEAVIKENGKEFYSVLFNFVHLGDPAKGEISIPGIKGKSMILQPGYNCINILIPFLSDTQKYNAAIKIKGKKDENRTFKVHAVRSWTIYLVEHAHTDIGYTRPQTEILPEHLRYIDYALDYCDQTDSYPDDARFRWTCETSWAVREYLRTRPQQQIERLKKRIGEKRIEVTGLFLNSSDLADEASIAAYLQPVKEFRDSGIPVVTAMQDDINGVPWCLVDYLSGCGIRYLNMGQNASRALKPFDRPTTFWWVSPSGKKILANRPEHYMFGNSLGILTNPETFGKALFRHLQTISEKGYPFDHYAIQFSGYLIDNSPPSTKACDLVKQWNEKYTWPKLRLSTISEFLSWVENTHLQDPPVIRGAWPDWWMDGFGSAAMETAYTRGSHEDLIATQGLMSMAMMFKENIPDHLFNLTNEITDDLAFYDEHTFGAAECITEPLVENSIVQLNQKAAYAWDAVKKNHILREELLGLIQPHLPKAPYPTITVINTMGFQRSGIATVYIDHQVVPKGMSFKLVDEGDQIIPVQAAGEREDGTYWAIDAKDISPVGYRTYRIKDILIPKKVQESTPFTGIFENNFYRLVIDKEKGIVKSLFDKKTGKELLDPDARYGMGQFIYERLGKNRDQLDQLRLDEVTRTTWKNITVSAISEGPVWKSIRIKGEVEGCADKDGITCEIRLFNSSKKIEFLYSMKKLPVTDPEGAYISFPFKLDKGHLVFEVAGGTVIPGKDQIEGSASDWDGIQNFVSVRNDNSQIVFVSPDIPLVQLGDLNLGKFSRKADPKTQYIYSWVLNNYWTTNFRAFQEGELKWRYVITSGNDPSNEMATKTGWSERMPFITRVFPGGHDSTLLSPFSFMYCLTNELMIGARPSADRKGIILQVREITGKETSVPVHDVLSSTTDLLDSTGAKSAYEVNVLEEVLSKLCEQPKIPFRCRLFFKPYETKFIKLQF